MNNHKLPNHLQHVLWSYDFRKINPRRDKHLLITQVLNHGVWRDVRWLFQNYREHTIKKVVSTPSRGVWFNPVLNFWTKYYGIKLSKKQYEDAIYEPNKIKDRYLKKTRHKGRAA